MATLGDIRWGTSGYAYKDWQETFYPGGLAPNDRLRHYSRHFDTVEVNSTYYRVGPPRNYETMRSRVPDDFVFSVKAPGSLTHERPADPKPGVLEFLGAIEPLGTGPILLQFPFSFRYEASHRRYLARLIDAFQDRIAVVEIRHDSWDRESVRRGLAERGVSWCCVDLPTLSGLPRASAHVTGSSAYIRLHGRNADRWWNHDESWERYNYSYTSAELEPWAARLCELQATANQVFVYANNHFRAQAVTTIHDLRELHERRSGVSEG